MHDLKVSQVEKGEEGENTLQEDLFGAQDRMETFKRKEMLLCTHLNPHMPNKAGGINHSVQSVRLLLCMWGVEGSTKVLWDSPHVFPAAVAAT